MLTSIDVFSRTWCIGECTFSIDFRRGVRIRIYGLPDGEKSIHVAMQDDQSVMSETMRGT